MSQTHTLSSLVDSVANDLKSFKCKEFPWSGDYYYRLIDNGILKKQKIMIDSAHLSDDTKIKLLNSGHKTILPVLYNAVCMIFSEKFGYGLLESAKKEDRIKVMIK